MKVRVKLITFLSTAVLLTGCAEQTGAGAPASPSATTDLSSVSVPPSATKIKPETPVVTPPNTKSGWPPIIHFGDIKEAGTIEANLGGVRIQIPGGFTETINTAAALEYAGTAPNSSDTGSIKLHVSPAAGADAGNSLKDEGSVTGGQFGSVEIANATSAAIAQKINGGIKTWVLAVITPAANYVTITFSCSSADFEAFLFPQSLGSVRVQ